MIKCNVCGFVHETETIEGDISKIIIYDQSGFEKMIKDFEKGIITMLKDNNKVAEIGIGNEKISKNNIKYLDAYETYSNLVDKKAIKTDKKMTLNEFLDKNDDYINSLNKEYSKYLKQDIRKENLIIAGNVAKIFSENHLIKYDNKNKKIIIYINAVDENGNYIKEYEIFLKNEKKEKADLVFEKKGKTKIYKCKNCGKELIKIT